MEKILGLDLGTTTVGIATNDSLGITVHPIETFRFEPGNFKAAREHVVELCQKEGIKDIVLGYPLYASGDLSPHAKSCIRFKDDLLKLDPTLNIELVDEAFTTTFDINYCALCGNYRESNLKHNGSSLVANSILSTDYLWKQVRVLGGAYGCMHSIGRDGKIYFVSYRDPNLVKTVETYEGIADYLRAYDADEREMTQYIIGAVSELDSPLQPSTKALRSFSAYMANVTVEDIKNTILETFKEFSKDGETIEPIIDKEYLYTNWIIVYKYVKYDFVLH